MRMCTFLGDFNLDISKSNYLRKVTSLANNSHMKQIINDFTRFYSLTYVVRKCSKPKLPPKVVKTRCFKHFNESDFVNTIKIIDLALTQSL